MATLFFHPLAGTASSHQVSLKYFRLMKRNLPAADTKCRVNYCAVGKIELEELTKKKKLKIETRASCQQTAENQIKHLSN